VPALADGGAAQVTMLQRSPTYIMNLPNRNGLFIFLKKLLPASWAYRITRWTNILLSMFMFSFSKLFPAMAKSLIMKGAAKELPPAYPVEKHFNPKYNPWDQRLCVIPDGDLFRVISEARASVVTDNIARFTERSIQLQSGEELAADIIVLATGLKVQLLGGASISINGKAVQINNTMIYKGMMVSNVPNLIYAFGYTNNSWTLKVDLTANYTCKLLNYMDRKGYSVVTPTQQEIASEESFLNLDSGYIQRASNVLPKQGKRRPWRVYQNYLVDMLTTRFGRIADGVLRFKKAPETQVMNRTESREIV
jgi:cation diffusion facilitator CzcD-associated flavoprotein CzcO